MKTQFELTPRWLWFHRIVGMLFLLFAALFLYGLFSASTMTYGERLCSIPLFIMYFLLVSFQNIYVGFSEKLELSPEGIRYRTFGYSVYTTWPNMVRLGSSRSGAFKFSGIFVSYFSQDVNSWFPGAIYGKETFIPLSKFSENWRENELGRQIKQYAPGLFA